MMRSKTLPAAPPRISARPQNDERSSRSGRQSIALTNATAASDSTINSVVRHSLDESLKMPKATPRFSECTMAKKPGITRSVSIAET